MPSTYQKQSGITNVIRNKKSGSDKRHGWKQSYQIMLILEVEVQLELEFGIGAGLRISVKWPAAPETTKSKKSRHCVNESDATVS